jgi:hypothetical protein
MSESVATIHGSVARVIDTPSQGISYLRVEIPIEYHAEATRLFYGKRVLLVLASEATAGQPFGILDVAAPAPTPPAAPKIAPATKADAPTGGPLSKSAATVCDTKGFQQFAWWRSTGIDEAPPEDYGSGDAAEFIRSACGVNSRAKLDHDAAAAACFRELMHDFREFLQSRPHLVPA